VITFEGNPAFGTAGEICVSVDAALRHVAPAVPTLSARLSALSSAAFSTELTLYVVHGWLHLAGYDDLVPAKKRVMRRAETRAMNILRTHDCLPRFTLR
jgi:probable rRNA maturation factor